MGYAADMADSGQPLLVCRGLTRRPWIDRFDLELQGGEIVALRAPSGSGKTLLLRALADLDPRDGGELTLQGRSIDDHDPSAWRIDVLYLHQAAVPFPGTADENVSVVAALDRAGDRWSADDPVASILSAAEVSADTPAEDLSGGEMQRLALYRALTFRPSVLLLDEATSALDSELATRAENAVRRFAADGGAVLWVSHDDTLPGRVADRVIDLPVAS